MALVACAAIGFSPLMLIFSGHLFGDIMATLTSNLCILWIWHYRFFTGHRKPIIAGVALALMWGFAFITKEFAVYYLLPMLIFFIDDKRKKQHARFWNGAIVTGVIILAVVIVPLIFMTLSRAIKQRFELHRKIARITWPLWMYVSVTGVVIYLMLYRFF